MAQAEGLGMQQQRLARHGHALQPLPLVQQFMGKNTSHGRMIQFQNPLRLTRLKEAARQIDTTTVHGERAARITQTPQIQPYARLQRLQRMAKMAQHKFMLQRQQAATPEH